MLMSLLVRRCFTCYLVSVWLTVGLGIWLHNVDLLVMVVDPNFTLNTMTMLFVSQGRQA